MRKFCKSCVHHWFYHLSDGRHKCRCWGLRQSFRSVWQSCRLSEASQCKLLECFVFGVPAYRLRFRGPASTEATERFFLLIRQTIAILESCREPLDGTIECDESSFGGHRKGKRGWGAAGKTLVFGFIDNLFDFAIKSSGTEIFRVAACESNIKFARARQSE